MPCNIGYATTIRVKVPAPGPQEFKNRTKSPKLDAELLRKLGESDPAFANWLQNLNTLPLLQSALEKALKNFPDTQGVSFSLTADGSLEATAKYKNKERRAAIERITSEVANRWQIEVLSLVAQLLGYQVVIYELNGSLVIEGEKEEEAKVHKYLKITKSGESASIIFEHFESKETMDQEVTKFLALARKLGIAIEVEEKTTRGKPIEQDIIHKDFLRRRTNG